jgi:hypothetical protein
VLIVLKNNSSEEILGRHKLEFETLQELKLELDEVVNDWDREHHLERATADEVEKQ